jgi:hypothetical protein
MDKANPSIPHEHLLLSLPRGVMYTHISREKYSGVFWGRARETHVRPLGDRKCRGYLHITFSGPFSLAAAKESVDAMVAACTREGYAKVLFDCRPMTGVLQVLDRFDVGEYGALTIPHSVQIAMLGREDQILPDKFFETVARNRGLMLALFSEIDEAIEWLKK